MIRGFARALAPTGCAILLLLQPTGPSMAASGGKDVDYLSTIRGPIEAGVVKVRDGDTVEVEAFVWPMQSVRVAVRLRGIDAPELHGKCASEKEAAMVARERLVSLIGEGRIRLSNIAGDKYFGRVLADVSTDETADVGRELLKERLVVRYDGGHKPDWCTATGSVKP
ncbi:thermonuclease family protein [Consotaella salsifontis]|uniref:TNase-like domain-containing protein n=1 Tax=Consotaella salsifontis TaxID=1365950 RepID=A0A1T4T4U3_9HYPH|nr:thermonuclease family protein [Consotaella salsifontis]SKA35515.1 hypothetical protein SAMN05428963_11950 [Consotaella salsifontis]